MGRRNVSGRKIDKESYDYYVRSYNANKSYYLRKGYNELIPFKMNKREWEYLKRDSNMSNREIIYEEFHKYSREEVENLVKAFKDKGLKTNKNKIARGEFSNNQWNIIKNTYKQLRDDGETASDAKASIAYMFWGSP